jgi:SAM-dependent methyltransferase
MATRLTAKTADRHVLYELSVQEPEVDVDFAERVYRALRGKAPRLLREDFCGTAAVSCEWVRRRRGNRALGVDLDASVLEWCRRHHVSRLDADQAARVSLVQADVLDVAAPKADLTLAMNFSYWIFKTRDELLAYFRSARRGLKADGLFVLDAFGGTEAQDVLEDRTGYPGKGFTYVWEQAGFDPITNETTCRIHFEFADGSAMRNAFVYHWRMWSPIEVCEALREAGFRTADVYWEGDGADGKGDDVFRRRRRAENCAGWIAFIVGAK